MMMMMMMMMMMILRVAGVSIDGDLFELVGERKRLRLCRRCLICLSGHLVGGGEHVKYDIVPRERL